MTYKLKLLNEHKALLVDDGRRADDLGVHDLNRALVRMKVEGVNASTGKQEALEKLAEHREAEREAAGEKYDPIGEMVAAMNAKAAAKATAR